MAFMMCSCNTEKKLMRESIDNYEFYDITDFDYLYAINSYNDYIVKLKQTIADCDRNIKEILNWSSYWSSYLALTPRGDILLCNSVLRMVLLEEIKEKTIDLLENATEENFTPKFYCCYEYEYYDKGDIIKYTKYVLLNQSNNKYELHLLTNVFISDNSL